MHLGQSEQKEKSPRFLRALEDGNKILSVAGSLAGDAWPALEPPAEKPAHGVSRGMGGHKLWQKPKSSHIYAGLQKTQEVLFSILC